MTPRISVSGLIFLAVMVVAGIFLGLSAVGFGIWIGAVAAVLLLRGGEPPWKVSAMVLVLGLLLFALAHYFASKHGVAIKDLGSLSSSGRFMRRLPFYSYATMTTGIVLLAWRGLCMLSQKSD